MVAFAADDFRHLYSSRGGIGCHPQAGSLHAIAGWRISRWLDRLWPGRSPLPCAPDTSGLKLTKVVTADSERRAQAMSEIADVEVLASADALWTRSSELDLVVISTPNRTHVPLALAGLDAGISVVLDKPFAPTAAQAREVIQKARGKHLLLSAYHVRRWDSECLTLRKLLEKGALGRVLRFESRLERWRPRPKGSWKERGVKEAAGGLLYDIGSHLIDQALFLFGPVRDVYAELDRHHDGVESDDDVFVALRHENGVRSHLWASVLAAQPGPRMRVMGMDASFVKRTGDVQESQLRAGMRPGARGGGEEPHACWGVLSDGSETESVKSERGAYQEFYAAMVRALDSGAPPPVDPEDAAKGLEVVEAAPRSAKERTVVRLNYA